MKSVSYLVVLMCLVAGSAHARIGAEPDEPTKTENATDAPTASPESASEPGSNPEKPAAKSKAEEEREAACETRVEKYLEYIKLLTNNTNYKGDGKGMYGVSADEIRKVQREEGQCKALQYISAHRNQRPN